jgi:hypothetical protein
MKRQQGRQQPHQQEVLPASCDCYVPKQSSVEALLQQSRSDWAQAERTSTPLEEKCSECLRAAQLEEQMESDSSRSSLSARSSHGLSRTSCNL